MRHFSSRTTIGLVGLVIGAMAAAGGATAQAATAGPDGSATRTSAARPVVADPDGIGTWTVTRTGHTKYQLTWTAPATLPQTDARPEFLSGGQLLGVPSLSPDGHTLTLVLSSTTEPPIADLDVVLSGRALDGKAAPTSAAVVPYVVPPSVVPPVDPGIPGHHRITSKNYRLPATKIAGLPDRVEMLGHVVEPKNADDTAPLVVFLHGRHEACYDASQLRSASAGGPGDWSCVDGLTPIPSYLGYDYVQRLLASQGYVTVSISANAINDQDYLLADGGAAARATLVRRHLAQWATWAADPDPRYQADLDDVILVGHSRGGEGVNRASVEIPLSAPYRVAGQVLIGPTDFGFQTAPYVPTVTLLPYCDGDVSDLEGQIFTDAARDMTPDDTALHSSVLVMGANHNFFNTEWTPGISAAPSFDDWSGDRDKTCGTDTDMRLSPHGQRMVGKTYIAGAVHLFADDDTDVLPMFDGSAVSVPSAGGADVRTHAIGGGRELRRPGLDSTVSASGHAITRLCVGRASYRATPRFCAPHTDSVRTPHWPGDYPSGAPTRRAFDMAWTHKGQQGGLRFDEPLDLTAAASLDLRTIVDPELGRVRLGVRLYDATGSARVVPEDHGRLFALPGGGYSLSKLWAQTLRVPLDAIAGTFDLSAVTGFDLVGRTGDGRVWVLDAAAVPALGLPPVPDTRVPTLSVKSVTHIEGDGPAEAMLPVPYLINKPTSTQSQVVVVFSDPYTGADTTQRVTIPAGTTSGTFDIPYQPDTRDDLARQKYPVSVFAVNGVSTNHYLTTATLLDDDPSPVFSVQAVRSRVTEGDKVSWKVTLSAPIDYFLGVTARPMFGDSGLPGLTVGDLSRRFRKRYFFPVPPLDRPLAMTRLRLFGGIDAGSTSTVLTLRTLADDKAEGRREITMRFNPDRLPISDPPSTVIVRDRG